MTIAILLSAVAISHASSESAWWNWLHARPGPTPGTIRAMTELRLTPEVLAAGGHTATSVTAIATAVAATPEVMAAVGATRDAHADDASELREALVRARLRPADEASRNALNAARLAEAESEAAASVAATRALRAILPPGAATLRLEQAARSPVVFDDPALLFVESALEESRATRLAEIHAGRRMRLGQQPAPRAATVLQTARGTPEYAAAAQGLAFNRAAIATLFTAP